MYSKDLKCGDPLLFLAFCRFKIKLKKSLTQPPTYIKLLPCYYKNVSINERLDLLDT